MHERMNECLLMQAAEEQQGLQKQDLKSQVLKEVVDARRHAKSDINTSIYRHNKAKGPNPMAAKKKKKRKLPVSAPQETASAAEPKVKRARKRRRTAEPLGDAGQTRSRST